MIVVASLAAMLTMASTVEPAATQPQREVTSPARDGVRVLLLSSGSMASDGVLASRIRRARAELEVGGFAPIIVAWAGNGEPDRQLDRLAEENGAAAIVVFATDRVQAELWAQIEDAPLSRIAIVVGDAIADDDDGVLAVRLTEILQASLLKVASEPEPVAPAPSVVFPPPRAPEQGPRWTARVGLHGAGSAQRVGFMLGPTLGVTVTMGEQRRFGLDVEAFSTALLGQVDDEAGRATVGLATFRALAQWWPIPTARVSPAIGGGVGPVVAWTRGSAVQPFTGKTDVTAVGIPTGAADLAIRLAPQLRLRFGVRVGVALPLVRVRGSASTVAVARPLFDGGVALELTPR